MAKPAVPMFPHVSFRIAIEPTDTNRFSNLHARPVPDAIVTVTGLSAGSVSPLHSTPVSFHRAALRGGQALGDRVPTGGEPDRVRIGCDLDARLRRGRGRVDRASASGRGHGVVEGARAAERRLGDARACLAAASASRCRCT